MSTYLKHTCRLPKFSDLELHNIHQHHTIIENDGPDKDEDVVKSVSGFNDSFGITKIAGHIQIVCFSPIISAAGLFGLIHNPKQGKEKLNSYNKNDKILVNQSVKECYHNL